MKIDEFIAKVGKVAYAIREGDYIYVHKDGYGNSYDWFLKIDPSKQGLNSVSCWECADDLRDVDLFYILGLVQELRKTPVKDRFPEKKYRIRFSGLNSDNGRQYLSTANGINGEFFACALRSYLKQEFTEKEIETIKNQTQFKSIPWFRMLMTNNIEEVKDDE